MMISWKLWQAIHVPFVSHPIYWLRITLEPPPPLITTSRIRHWLKKYHLVWKILLTVIAVGLLLRFGMGILLLTVFGLPMLLLFAGIPLALISAGTVYGLISALTISDAIATEKLQGRYALLGTTPAGLPVATWAISSLAMHSTPLLKHIRSVLAWIYMGVGSLLGLPVLFSVLLIIIYPQEIQNEGSFVNTAITFSSFFLLPFIDYFQSSTVGALVGMIAPSLASGKANTCGYVLLIYLSLQFATYLLVGFICLLIWLQLYNGVGFVLLCLPVLYICREIIIYVLWFSLSYVLDTDINELNAAIRLKLFWQR